MSDSNSKFAFNKSTGLAAGAIGSTALIVESPVMAQTASTGVTDITAMVTSLGTLAGAVTAVVLGAMVVRLGIKFVNRMTVKG